MWIIVCGNPVDGLYFVGPFPEHGEALTYAEDAIDAPWHIAYMYGRDEDG